MTLAARLCLERDGAEHLTGAVTTLLGELRAWSDKAAPPGRAGVRLSADPWLSHVLAPEGAIGSLAVARRGRDCRAVRAILFDKSIANNWALGWHQDRTIAVAERHDVQGYRHWTCKAGVRHVEPPMALLSRMLTIRIHLDPVDADNAPLLVALGSHRSGRIPEHRIDEVIADEGRHVCLADAGDVWLYATPILHASDAAARPRRRRVLQVDFAAGDLPGGLAWAGV